MKTLPWAVVIFGGQSPADGEAVAFLQGPTWRVRDRSVGLDPSDAALIVERVNGWDTLVAERDAALAEVRSLKAAKPKIPLCWGCEGNPSDENDPCEVCGLSSRATLRAGSLEVE